MKKKLLAFTLALVTGVLSLVSPAIAAEGTESGGAASKTEDPCGDDYWPYDHLYLEKGEDGELYLYHEYESGEIELCRNQWKDDGFSLYYADENGRVLKNCWRYLTTPIGDQKKWYYFTDSGLCAEKWTNIDGKWYYFDWAMETEWMKIERDWYYMGADGAMRTGWVHIGSDWYYFQPNGKMAVGWIEDNGKWYYLRGMTNYEYDGKMVTGWLQDNGKWYYLNKDGSMATGWVLDAGKWYYLNKDGSMATGWVLDNGKWYYLKSDGAMACKETLRIDGKKYSFDQLGVWYK